MNVSALSLPQPAGSSARERNFFLIYALLIWAAIIAGFGLEMTQRFAAGKLHYPLIVHAHAIAFVSWLALLSAQIALIRRGKAGIHRRLGIAAVVLIPLMAFLAIETVIVMNTQKYGSPDTSFPFMSVQFTNVLASSALFIAALLMRRSPAIHKRLMLMGTLVLTEPGFRRVVSYLLDGNFHVGFWPFMAETYAGTLVLMLGLAAYDLSTRRRLHALYVPALAWCVANQLLAAWLFHQPGWARITTHLVGH